MVGASNELVPIVVKEEAADMDVEGVGKDEEGGENTMVEVEGDTSRVVEVINTIVVLVGETVRGVGEVIKKNSVLDTSSIKVVAIVTEGVCSGTVEVTAEVNWLVMSTGEPDDSAEVGNTTATDENTLVKNDDAGLEMVAVGITTLLWD